MASAAAGAGEAPAATNASGTRYVGEWALGHRIGSGSFAVVWKAVHGGSGEVAAVKEIWTEKLNAKLRESLESEMSILTRTEHPNIVRLLEIIKEKEAGRIYLVLEFCAGGDLSGLLRRVRTLPEAVLRSLMQQLAAGLRELRSLNLIHRDLKPQNLLLSGPGPDAVLKIADFGFARDLQPQGLAETLCGSPLYMAPEILQFRKYDAKADLWSIGAILFEMAAGQPPFNGRNHVELLRNIERQEARLPVAAAARTSPACKQLLTMLLRRNPVERIGFEEFFSHPFLSDAPPSPPGPPTPAPSTAISPRDRPPRAAQQPPPGRPPASLSPSPTIRAVSSPIVPEVRVAAVPVEATTPAAAVVARTAPGTGGGMAALMEAASGGSGSRFTPSSLPRLPAALWDAFSGGRAASNAQDQRRQQFGPLGEGLKLVERAASGGGLTGAV
uniref:Protein kinase domain-containing protein n=1 Tax=Tetraselmis chuii TaxID=63592 RepID=A0A7S1SKK1_9CHLO|mmetsp:Transcript_17024/g.30422  ORF Transcript_17024/g.30422 Transcript_17024/m.30422 type:complete len:443 (+) Transcript_17024:358-1686(+)